MNDEETDGWLVAFDSSTIAPSFAVIDAMAQIRNTEPTGLDPLYDAVDPEALDALCTDRGRPTECEIAFTYLGHTIQVKCTGGIAVTPNK